MSCTEHTITTSENKVLHCKHISKPSLEIPRSQTTEEPGPVDQTVDPQITQSLQIPGDRQRFRRTTQKSMAEHLQQWTNHRKRPRGSEENDRN